MAEAIAEIRESDAPPHVAAIYADIRAQLRVPVVFLIYRFLATIPGALEAAWGALRPLYADGSTEAWIPALLGEVRTQARPIALAPLVPDAATRAVISRILATYNRGNPRNLVSFIAILAALREPAGPAFDLAALTAGRAAVAPADPAVVGPLAYSQLPAHLRHVVDDLTARTASSERVIPTLYLHLAHWPALLEALHVRLVPLFETGEIARSTGNVREAAGTIAASLRLRLAGELPPDQIPQIERILGAFTSAVIPQLIAVGAVLHRALECGEK